jgi:hypothetical protein
MKEFITIAVSFLLVVGFAFYMFISNKEHSMSVTENRKTHELVIQNHEELKNEIELLKNHIRMTDSIYHTNK